jgi:hypothetical protein
MQTASAQQRQQQQQALQQLLPELVQELEQQVNAMQQKIDCVEDIFSNPANIQRQTCTGQLWT